MAPLSNYYVLSLLPNIPRSLQVRLGYIPQRLFRVVLPLYVIHATPSFHGAVTHPDLGRHARLRDIPGVANHHGLKF